MIRGCEDEDEDEDDDDGDDDDGGDAVDSCALCGFWLSLCDMKSESFSISWKGSIYVYTRCRKNKLT